MAFNIVSIVLLIFCSAFFSGSETTFAAASAVRLRRNAEENPSRAARWAVELQEGYDNALITILLGNNLVNIASSSLATVIAITLMGERYAWVATAVMTVVILICGEITPKVLASQMPDKLAPVIAVPLHFLNIVFKPVVRAAKALVDLCSRLWKKGVDDGPAVTEDDLEILIENAEDEGVIDEEKSDLLQNALDFDEVLAYEVITPRVDVLALDIEEATRERLEEIVQSAYSRVPVYRDSIDNIIGILSTDHLLRKCLDGTPMEKVDIAGMLLPARFVHRAMPLPDVLAEMRENNSHMVVVTDEYGGTMGVLTMEDVLEQLVGEIWDETDEIETEFNQIEENSYDVDGDMRLHDLFEELDIDDREFDFENATIGGWAIEMLNDYPREGDSFEYRNLKVTVTKTQNLRVRRLRVDVTPPPEEEEEQEEN